MQFVFWDNSKYAFYTLLIFLNTFLLYQILLLPFMYVSNCFFDNCNFKISSKKLQIKILPCTALMIVLTNIKQFLNICRENFQTPICYLLDEARTATLFISLIGYQYELLAIFEIDGMPMKIVKVVFLMVTTVIFLIPLVFLGYTSIFFLPVRYWMLSLSKILLCIGVFPPFYFLNLYGFILLEKIEKLSSSKVGNLISEGLSNQEYVKRNTDYIFINLLANFCFSVYVMVDSFCEVLLSAKSPCECLTAMKIIFEPRAIKVLKNIKGYLYVFYLFYLMYVHRIKIVDSNSENSSYSRT